MKSKKAYIRLSLLLLVLSLIVVNSSFQMLNIQKIFTNPKLNVGEITIITPENKTYTEPMSGYYPATYGFENDLDGSIPEGWIDDSTGTSQVFLISVKDSHNKIVKIDDDSSTNYGMIKHNISPPQLSGTIELWLYKESGNAPAMIRLKNATEYPIFEIRMDMDNNGRFEYASGPSTWVEFANGSYSDHTWFHIAIDFECGTGGYRGLSEDTLNIYINGEEVASDISSLNNIDFNSLSYLILDAGYTNHYAILYYDAVGLSWDPHYNIGDNLNEGLLLSYENSTNLDWKAYSFDGQANNVILGNTTILMPDDGVHNIKVFGNDSIGTMYESNLRYFTVATGPPEIAINSPISSQVIGNTAPSYDLSITGPFDSIWYTLDGGLTNITASGLSGTINQTEWGKITDGIVTLKFYANNSAAFVGNAQVQVIKSSQIPPRIPGYDLIALLGVSCVVTLLILKKRT